MRTPRSGVTRPCSSSAPRLPRTCGRSWGRSRPRLAEPGSALVGVQHVVEALPGAVEPVLADAGQPLGALPERQRLLERGAAGLEPADDLDQLLARLLVGDLFGLGLLGGLGGALLSHRCPRSARSSWWWRGCGRRR